MFCCVKLLRVVTFFTLISKIAPLPFAGTNGRGRLRREACQFADINTSSALPPPTGRARNKKSTWHRGSFNAIICYCVRDVIPMDSRGTFGCRWFFWRSQKSDNLMSEESSSTKLRLPDLIKIQLEKQRVKHRMF